MRLLIGIGAGEIVDDELSPIPAHRTNYNAHNLERTLWSNGFKIWICGLEVKSAVFIKAQSFHGYLTVDDRDDDVARPRRPVLFDDDKVTIQQADISHRLASHAAKDRSVRVIDKVVVNCQQLRWLLSFWLRFPRFFAFHRSRVMQRHPWSAEL